ncbi:MAG: tRNA preQ1(34) S-adenosylmethionine ribosyltransferase-isomerase QueA [Microthrixaceae bacterium]
MRTDDLDYELPGSSIAQTPAEPRDSARLLVDAGPGAPPQDRVVRDLPSLVRPGDVVVLNETRVLPARVAVRRAGGGTGEVLLLEERDEGWWEALTRPGRKLRAGDTVRSVAGELEIEIGPDLPDGRKLVRPLGDGDLRGALAAAGELPLPPYIHEPLERPDRYQTVFAGDRAASAAAPTAGLHLTPAVLDGLRDAGAAVCTVELVVGLDTFRPVTTERLEDHVIHTERYEVPRATWDEVQAARAEGRRVVAVGTTCVRALESVAVRGELAGRTDLFITPGFPYRVVDVLLTNFHLPRSSLLALVEAFVGTRWRDLYATAIDRGYRFLSFGDAMLLGRTPLPGSGPAEGGSAEGGDAS